MGMASVDKALAGVDRKTGISEMDPNTRRITENYTKAVLKYRQMKKRHQQLTSKMEECRSLYSEMEAKISETTDSLELAIV